MRLKSAHLVFVAAISVVGIARAGDDRTDRREALSTDGMKVHVVRLRPGEDLLKSIGSYVREKKITAGIILTTVGSLTVTTLRFANRREATTRTGQVEIVSLVGTVEPGGGHLHLSVADGEGVTFGGHLLEGCKIYTTAEIAIGELPQLRFLREPDSDSGYEVDLSPNLRHETRLIKNLEGEFESCPQRGESSRANSNWRPSSGCNRATPLVG